MYKKLLSLPFLFLFCYSTLSFSQLTNQFYFFKGDTLDGFDVNACFRDAQKARIDLKDVSGYIKRSEAAFVKGKYHLVFKKSVPEIPVPTAACSNLDFEDGLMTNWTGKVGENDNSQLPLAATTAGFQSLGNNSGETTCSYTTLVNTGTDNWGLFPMVDPGGGTWACRLGGDNANYRNSCNKPASGVSPGESIQQTFLVTAANAMLTYNYAVVLEQPSGTPHTATECPYFKAEVLDHLGDTIPCMQYYVESASAGTPPGMSISGSTNFGDNMFFSNWRSNSMNLKLYIGTNVTIRFTAAGCALGGHVGYAYVDAFCGPIQVLASSPEVCEGGTLTLTAPPVGQGGTYSWKTVPPGGPGIVGSSTGQAVTLNANGTYEVTVTARPGCFYKIDTVIAFYPLPTPVATNTPTTCAAPPTGTASVTSATGNTPFTYSWNTTPSQTTATATALPAGTYSVTLTTTDGCAASTSTTVTAPSAPTATIVNTPVSCFGGTDGTATVTAAVGNPAYTYSWNPAPASGTAATTSGLSIGTYTCTVTDSKSCTVTATTTVAQPPVLAATNTPVNVLCFGGTNGSITVSPTGGTGPYTFSWNPAPASGTTATASALSAGTYTCTVTDSKACVTTTTATITEPTQLTATTSSASPTCGATNGSGSVVAANATPAYTYSWNTTPAQTTATASALGAGTFTCTITDKNGCVITPSVTLTSSGGPTVTANPPVNVTCFGLCNGTASVNATGGTGTLTYSWSPSGGTTNTATALCPNTYTCSVTDASGCPNTTTVVITQPALLVATATGTNVSCFGLSDGTATGTATGGTTAYTYSWTPAPGTGQGSLNAGALAAATYTLTLTDANNCVATAPVTIAQPSQLTATTSNTAGLCGAQTGTATVTPANATPAYTYSWNTVPVQTTATANALGAGTYMCTINDKNGCTISPSVTVTSAGGPTVTPNPVINVTCFGLCNGSASVNATGGTAPLTFSWTPSGGTTNTATGLCPNTYTCTVTDATGCPTSTTLIITQPSALVVGTTGTNVSCFGLTDGTATGTASGGTPAYTYSWNPAPGGGQGSLNATGLGAGTYTLTVTDANGCVTTSVVTITQPPLLAMTAAGVDATCFGKCNGQLICIPTGGTPSYTYSWSTGCTAASCNGICVGTYTSNVTDAHGCKVTTTATVGQPTPLALSMTPTPSHCSHSDGADSVSASGGTNTFTYTWTPPVAGVPSHGTAYHNIPANTYTVLVHDANGCADSMNNVVPNLPGVNIAFVSATNVTCFGGHDGTATVAGSGGFPPYTYSWSPTPLGAQGATTATGLSAGTYTCTITDVAGCTSFVTAPITEPPLLVLIPGPPATICIGQCTDLSATASGGTPAYTYSWTLNGVALPGTHVCPVLTTIYTVTCSDSHGCLTAPVTITITVNPALEVVTANAANICPGSSDTLHATGSGGNGTYFYNWSPAAGLSSTTVQNPVATPTSTSTYTVIVSDNCGTPTDTAFVTVTLWPLPAVTFLTIDTVGCAPMCANFVGVSNPACASAVWTFGDGTSTNMTCSGARHCYNTAGTYNVSYSVTDIHGCKGSLVIPNYINAYPVPTAAFTDSPQPTSILQPEITFTDQSSGETSWLWNFGDFTGATSTLQNPKYTYPDTGCFTATLTVFNNFGCKDITQHPICIEPDFTFYAPNTFTPNNDGKNDTWSPKGIGIDPNHYDLIMFDRWGNLMWETHVWGQGWDGRANDGNDVAQIDTYVWKVVLLDFRGNKHQYMGHCNIIK
jgi:gliding motility-associated-like protein